MATTIITLAHGIKAVSIDGSTVAKATGVAGQLLQDNWEVLAAHDHNTLYYTQQRVTELLETKAELSHTHDDRYYTETEVDLLIAALNNLYYTKAEVDALIAG